MRGKVIHMTKKFTAGCVILTAIIAGVFVYKYSDGSVVPEAERSVAWRADFSLLSSSGGHDVPDGWKLMGKPGVRLASFYVDKDDAADVFLHMEADKASGSLIAPLEGVDLNKTPIMRWRWRVKDLPKNADGRYPRKDDQAIGIYVGTGSMSGGKKTISYRWDTETPKGAKGSAKYGLGTVKVEWETLRNKVDAVGGEWFVEEQNVGDAFREAWGYCPEEVYLSISCNSQYTGTTAGADLDWVEFIAVHDKTKKEE